MAGLFDKVVVGINKGVATVGANSKAVIEKAKVNTAITAIEKERSRLIQLLGQKVYDSFSASGEVDMAAVEEFSAQITTQNSQIAEKQAQLKLIDEELKSATGADAPATLCACGFDNQDDSKFCVKCGSKIG